MAFFLLSGHRRYPDLRLPNHEDDGDIRLLSGDDGAPEKRLGRWQRVINHRRRKRQRKDRRGSREVSQRKPVPRWVTNYRGRSSLLIADSTVCLLPEKRGSFSLQITRAHRTKKLHRVTLCLTGGVCDESCLPTRTTTCLRFRALRVSCWALVPGPLDVPWLARPVRLTAPAPFPPRPWSPASTVTQRTLLGKLETTSTIRVSSGSIAETSVRRDRVRHDRCQ